MFELLVNIMGEGSCLLAGKDGFVIAVSGAPSYPRYKPVKCDISASNINAASAVIKRREDNFGLFRIFDGFRINVG